MVKLEINSRIHCGIDYMYSSKSRRIVLLGRMIMVLVSIWKLLLLRWLIGYVSGGILLQFLFVYGSVGIDIC